LIGKHGGAGKATKAAPSPPVGEREMERTTLRGISDQG
jgi:hypothetical protein